MRENALFTAIIAILEAGEPVAGIPNVNGSPGVPVYQSYQPTQQGIPTGPAAFLHIIGHYRFGTVQREDYFDADQSKEFHRETQWYETTFQLDALATQNPSDLEQYTAGDIVNAMAYILQSDNTLAALQAQEMGIERITNIRSPKFTDDRDRSEASPNFDFVITHKQIVTNEIPVLQFTEFQIIDV